MNLTYSFFKNNTKVVNIYQYLKLQTEILRVKYLTRFFLSKKKKKTDDII